MNNSSDTCYLLPFYKYRLCSDHAMQYIDSYHIDKIELLPYRSHDFSKYRHKWKGLCNAEGRER